MRPQLRLYVAATSRERIRSAVASRLPRGTSTRLVLQAQLEGIRAAKPGVVAPGHHIDDGRRDQGRTAQTRPHHRYDAAISTDLVHPRRLALHRHRRPRRRRHEPSARAGDGVHDRARHLHPASVLDSLPKTPANLALIEKVQPAVQQVRGHRRPHRGFVPAGGVGFAQSFYGAAENDRGRRGGDACAAAAAAR